MREALELDFLVFTPASPLSAETLGKSLAAQTWAPGPCTGDPTEILESARCTSALGLGLDGVA